MINKKNTYQRDDKTMENIKKKLYEVKKISVAVKSCGSYARYKYLRNTYPNFAIEIDEILKSFVKPKVVKVKDVKVKKEVMHGEELFLFIHKKVTEEFCTIRELTKDKLISKAEWQKLPEEQRKHISIIIQKNAFAKKYTDYTPDPKPCVICGKIMHYEDFKRIYKGNSKNHFFKKMTCSEACANVLRVRNYGAKDIISYKKFEKPLTFSDYIMGELSNLYGADISKHRKIELFSEDSGLPIEQIERILSCQELLTVNTAKRMNQSGVAFKVDVMMELQMREVRV
jgi:hypothetical protein